MQNILLITDIFPPAMAPRMGFLCKWLKQNTSWNVTVLHPAFTADGGAYFKSFDELVGFVDDEVEFVYDDGISAIKPLENLFSFLRGERSVRQFIETEISRVVFHICGRTANFDGKRKIASILSHKRFDVILCSFSGSSIYELGEYARRVSSVPIVYDVRDAIEQEYEEGDALAKFVKRMVARRTIVLRRAARVVTVLQCLARRLEAYDDTLKCVLIYNGFDPDIFKNTHPTPNKVFRIAYCGSFDISYRRQRLYDFIEGFRLFLDKCGVHNDVEVVFYSPKHIFEEEIRPNIPIDQCRFFHSGEKVSHNDVANTIFCKSSILLCFERDLGTKEVGFSTKISEYMASNRPILCLGSPGRFESERIIQNSNAGVVANSPKVVADFLEEKYREWVTCGYVLGSADLSYVDQFSRATQAKQFLAIFDELCKQRIVTNE